MSVSTAAFLVIMGLVPSLVWLLFYFKKDSHPEPKYLLTKTFLLGIVLAPLAVAAQWIFRSFLVYLQPGFAAQTSVWFFLWAALIEEIVKYWAVKYSVIHNAEFDEPVDAMIYMISAAMGFAAIENILVLFQAFQTGAGVAVQIWLLRFAGATLLHAASSAVVGYFLALSWFYAHHSSKLIALGVLLATIVHFVFNLILLGGNGTATGFMYSMIFIVIIASLVSTLFTKLKKERIPLSTTIETA